MPMNQVSNIDVAIGISFNDLIFRLTGSNNPTNIKKIAPSLKIKKDFLISYEPININDQPFLITKFDKDSLIEKLESLQMAIIGYNRPTIMVLMKIEDGNKPPYFLNTSSNSPLDNKIKIILEEVSNQRGIFFELPVFDLEDVSYTHLRAHETVLDLVCRLLLEKKKNNNITTHLVSIFKTD